MTGTHGRFVACLAPPGGCRPGLVVHVGAGSVAVVASDEHGGDHFVGVLDGRAVWAVDREPDDGVPLMGLWGRVDDVVWTVAGRAVQLVEWDRTHRYCGRCATPTEPSEAANERARRCPACGLLAFPRLAPAMIVLVTRDGGREALLARGARFPVPMWSCLAGFVEPGESLEDAVHREVREEVGISVDDVRYWGSQPWPFPHSLMLGFRASWSGGELELDREEIADAGWYRPDELPAVPPAMSIARRIIDDWVAAAPR